MYVKCWHSFSGNEKGHIAQGNNIALYGWTVLGIFHMGSLKISRRNRCSPFF